MESNLDHNMNFHTILQYAVIASTACTLTFDLITHWHSSKIVLSDIKPAGDLKRKVESLESVVCYRLSEKIMLCYCNRERNYTEIELTNSDLIDLLRNQQFSNGSVFDNYNEILQHIQDLLIDKTPLTRVNEIAVDTVHFISVIVFGCGASYYWLGFDSLQEIGWGMAVPLSFANMGPLSTAFISEINPAYTSSLMRVLLGIFNIFSNISSSYAVGIKLKLDKLTVIANGCLGGVPMQVIMWSEKEVIRKLLLKLSYFRSMHQEGARLLLHDAEHKSSYKPLQLLLIIKMIVGVLFDVRIAGIEGFEFHDGMISLILFSSVFLFAPFITSLGVFDGKNSIHKNARVIMWAIVLSHLSLTKALQEDGAITPNASYLADLFWFVVMLVTMIFYKVYHCFSPHEPVLHQSQSPSVKVTNYQGRVYQDAAKEGDLEAAIHKQEDTFESG